jgi:hypothetical protein
MLGKLEQIYKIAQSELNKKGETEGVYAETSKKTIFGNLPEGIQELIKITEPNMPADAQVELGFSHIKDHVQAGPIHFPESFSFFIFWRRSSLSEEATAAVDGIHFLIESTAKGLRYSLDAGSSTSNMRSNRLREDILAEMVSTIPQGEQLIMEYQEITLLLQMKKFQDQLLEECVGIFLD